MAKRKLNAFEKQFVANRRAGKSSFSYGGKSYSTKLAGGGGGKAIDKSSTAATTSSSTLPKRAPKPTAKPAMPTPKKGPIPAARPSSTTAVKTGPYNTDPAIARWRDERIHADVANRQKKAKDLVTKLQGQREDRRVGALQSRAPAVNTAVPKPAAAAAKPAARPVDLNRTAADVADTRKRMELVTRTPSPRGLPVKTATATKVTTPAPPRPGSNVDAVRRAEDIGDVRKRMELVTKTPSPRGLPVKTASVTKVTPTPGPTVTTAKTSRLPAAGATTSSITKTTPKTGRLQKTTNVDAVFKNRWK